MRENIRFCYVALSLNRIEILLSHFKFQKKFKNRNSLFYLIQCFKTNICFIWFNVSRLFISLTHIKLFTFQFSLFTFTHLHTHAHNPSCHPISNTPRPKMMSLTFNISMTPTKLKHCHIILS